MLEKHIALAKRRKESLSLIIVDLDHFKKINDTYGHPAGDQLLKQITGIFSKTIRSADILARYGGEEFAVIMPSTNVSGSFEKAERIRQNVKSTTFDNIVSGQSLKITASIGISSYPEHETKYKELISAADNALYKAKNSGRNNVATACRKEYGVRN